jgi:hypothetical protein
MVGKIEIEKDPALADLGAGDEPDLRATPQLLRMHLEEASGLEERQGLHRRSHASGLRWE